MPHPTTNAIAAKAGTSIQVALDVTFRSPFVAATRVVRKGDASALNAAAKGGYTAPARKD